MPPDPAAAPIACGLQAFARRGFACGRTYLPSPYTGHACSRRGRMDLVRGDGHGRPGREVIRLPAAPVADRAGLTQEALAEAARISYRSVSDLERGVNRTARRETARLLADALGLSDAQRAAFEAAARGQPPAFLASAPDAPLAGQPGAVAAATRTLPRDTTSFTGRERELAAVLDAVAAPPFPAGSWASARSAGWPASARPPWRCTPRTGSRAGSPTARSSCRCTATRPASGPSIRPRRWPACWRQQE